MDRRQMEIKKVKEHLIPLIPQRDALGRAYATGHCKLGSSGARRIVMLPPFAGKRKTSVARVWVTEGNGTVIVNKMHMVPPPASLQ